MPATRRGGRRRLGRELAASFPASDFALWSAGVTFFALLGLVPLSLVSLWLAALLVGADRLLAGVDVAIGGLPTGHGTPQALRVLATTAVQLDGWQVLVALFPATLYGEGLRRAFSQLSPTAERASSAGGGASGCCR